jgi:sugar phosphate isomerase/epimerase
LSFEEIIFNTPDYPFKLCTTTFIYPADWVANARALGRSFDELELLLFESAQPDSLPTRETVCTLAKIAAELDFTWNVHLPIDIHPGHTDRAMRQQAGDVIKRVIDRVAPLFPNTHTLHLPGIIGRSDETSVKKWQDRSHETLAQITRYGINGSRLTIENIPDYPLELALPLIDAFGLEICLDIGHLLIGGASIASAFKTFGDRVTLMHIHGVAQGRDHRSLARLPKIERAALFNGLKKFTGVVSLEVFSKKDLMTSLECLKDEWG